MTTPDQGSDPIAFRTARSFSVSVLIPTYNRCQILLQTLDSLRHQTLPLERYEVIVAVDGSTDDTVEALRQYHPPYQFRWIYQPNGGCASACNAAARLAQHEVFVFLDDDQLASPQLLATHVRSQEGRPVLVQGFYPLAPGYAWRGASIVYEGSYLRSLAPTDRAHPSTAHIWSANISVTRETFQRVGGFDESFREYGGEDTDFGLRVAGLGIPVIFEPEALSYHQHDVSYASVRRQAFCTGKSLVRLARKHDLALSSFSGGEPDRDIDRRVGLVWRRSPRLMEALGRTLTLGLLMADAVRLRPAQVTLARLVRRYYTVGGIALESAAQEAHAHNA